MAEAEDVAMMLVLNELLDSDDEKPERDFWIICSASSSFLSFSFLNVSPSRYSLVSLSEEDELISLYCYCYPTHVIQIKALFYYCNIRLTKTFDCRSNVIKKIRKTLLLNAFCTRRREYFKMLDEN